MCSKIPGLSTRLLATLAETSATSVSIVFAIQVELHRETTLEYHPYRYFHKCISWLTFWGKPEAIDRVTTIICTRRIQKPSKHIIRGLTGSRSESFSSWSISWMMHLSEDWRPVFLVLHRAWRMNSIESLEFALNNSGKWPHSVCSILAKEDTGSSEKV